MYGDLIDILEKYSPNKKWEIQKPNGGHKKRCYIASNGKEKYFIKFDVPGAALKRLGDIGVAPKVLFLGEYGNENFVIQEFINGNRPENKAWLRSNVDELARIVRIYHQDQPLFSKLAEIFPMDFRQHIRQDIACLSERFSRIEAGFLQTEKIRQGFEQLKISAESLEPTSLVPIHAEPNPSNMFISGGKLVFFDWDEITLSDPMRDIGLLLWWNFPLEQWRIFFEKYGMEMTGSRLDKIYWFSARASFEIALWFAEHDFDGQDFVQDFLAALNEQPNPQGYSEY